jgi:hypothetical protein
MKASDKHELSNEDIEKLFDVLLLFYVNFGCAEEEHVDPDLAANTLEYVVGDFSEMSPQARAAFANHCRKRVAQGRSRYRKEFALELEGFAQSIERP